MNQAAETPGNPGAKGNNPFHDIIGFFARNTVAGNLLMLLLLGGGLFAASNLEIEDYPDLESRQISITVPFPGSSPAEVEESVNRRLEENLIAVEGVYRVTSTATEGLATVTINLEPFADPVTVLDDVTSAVDRIEGFPPLNAEQPEIVLSKAHRIIMTVAVTSTALTRTELRAAAEQVQEDLLALPSLSMVSLFGAADREISIVVGEEQLRRNNLTISELARAIRESSLNVSSGELRTDAGGLILRTDQKRMVGEDFLDVVLIANIDGTIVRLRDVATVIDGFADVDVDGEVDGVPAMFLNIRAADIHDMTQLASDARNLIENYEPPAGTSVFVWDDNTALTGVQFRTVIGAGLLGFALVFLFLSLVFDFRIAVWVAIGVPTSMLGALLFFPAFGLTLNVVTLFTLLLAVGIVVDDAVVVGESIATQRENGLRGSRAAIAGANAVVAPVTVGVLTTMIAFVPLAFTFGPTGQLLNTMPLIIVLVLSVSLIEAFLILPAHLSHSSPWSRPPLTGIQGVVRDRLNNLRDRWVVGAIASAVRRPYLTIVTSVVLVVAVVLVAMAGTQWMFLRTADANRIQADIVFPTGTPYETTWAAAEQLIEAAHATNRQAGDDPVTTVAAVVGHHFGAYRILGSKKSTYGTHLASVTMHIRDESQRSLRPADLETMWRHNVGQVRGVESIRYNTALVPNDAEIQYALVHPDEEAVVAATNDLRSAFGNMPALFQVEDSLGESKRQFDLELTEAGIAAGLSPAGLAVQLRNRFYGAEVQRIQRGRDEIRVMARYPQERRRSVRELLDERILRPGGAQIPLSAVARIVETRDYSTLTRIDGVRAATVSGRVDRRLSSPNAVMSEVEDDVAPRLSSKYPGLRVVRQGRGEGQSEINRILRFTVPLALLFMYFLMAVQLRSYWQPALVLAGLPFAIAGGLLAHLVLGYDLSITSVFGMVAVGGVVVNDTLVLMDRYNRIRAESAATPAIAAVSAAARQRFRAIFLTTITTIVGLMPVIYGKSEVTQGLLPMVISMAGGLIAASAALLFFVPALVLIVDGTREAILGPGQREPSEGEVGPGLTA